MEARAQRHQNVAGDVSFAKSHLLRSHAVDREVQPGLVEQLVQVHIDGAGDRTDLFGHSRRKREVVRHVAADDLNVNRGRQAKVQNLGDDVGWLEEERSGGESLRQLFAQLLHIIGSRVMFCLKRDQDLRIEITHGFAIAVRKIDSARRQADVVENATQLRSWYQPANDVFRFTGDARRLLNARARLGPQMEA